MEKIHIKKTVSLKIERINEISFHCKELPDNLSDKLSDEKIIYGIGVELLPNPDRKEFGIALTIKYAVKTNGISEDLCSYEIECVFKIKEFDDVMSFNNKKLSIDNRLLLNLLSITIGTIRGMLALKTSGTILNKYPLPLMNPVGILKQLKSKGKLI